MEHKKLYDIILFFSIALSMAVRAITILKLTHGNTSLMIAFLLVSLFSFFLGICYSYKKFSKNLRKWLRFSLGCMMLIVSIVEIICFKVHA